MKRLSLLSVLLRKSLFLLLVILLQHAASAEEVVLLYTGQTHAMIYTCSCPLEKDGGISRRATLVKEMRQKYPDLLLLDAGAFTAGGPLDEFTQNSQLDMQRSKINFKAMEMMRYDAVNIGNDEFNFGRDFLEKEAVNSGIKFLSCNINKSKSILPYMIKKVKGTRIGIIGLTDLGAMPKAQGLEFVEPVAALKNTITKVRKEADIIIVLSHLGESGDLSLINNVPGIDVLISGGLQTGKEPFVKVNSTLMLRPSWQARKLNKAVLDIGNKKITKFSVDDTRLSDKIKDDAEILKIMPDCFSGANCKKEGFIGQCIEPGTMNSKCKFEKAQQVNITVIKPKDCVTCNTEGVLGFFKKVFSNLKIINIEYPGKQAEEIIASVKPESLPLYLFDESIVKDEAYVKLKNSIMQNGKYYVVDPKFSGFSYFLGRNKAAGQRDLFINLFEKDAASVLEAVKEFNPAVHFFASENEKAAGGSNAYQEEEYMRAVCIEKYYPQDFWDYITCRSKNIYSSWWQDCLGKLDPNKISACARSAEGKELLDKNSGLTKELKINFGPTFLMNNQEIFGIKGAPNKEELKSIIK
ncbi:MAG: hypothetical protein C4533_01645 [Candidatus Omnitrophota bacterium]|jgi:hypothetical protein|nr:MAG: hypothetical protein C4533_01645 [Candidatus Omnitrophota bacterium]